MIEYKGYTGVYEFDEKRNLFHGKVAQIEDVITFQGNSIKELQASFERAIEDYIAWCKKYRSSAKSKTIIQKDDEGNEK